MTSFINQLVRNIRELSLPKTSTILTLKKKKKVKYCKCADKSQYIKENYFIIGP